MFEFDPESDGLCTDIVNYLKSGEGKKELDDKINKLSMKERKDLRNSFGWYVDTGFQNPMMAYRFYSIMNIQFVISALNSIPAFLLGVIFMRILVYPFPAVRTSIVTGLMAGGGHLFMNSHCILQYHEMYLRGENLLKEIESQLSAKKIQFWYRGIKEKIKADLEADMKNLGI